VREAGDHEIVSRRVNASIQPAADRGQNPRHALRWKARADSSEIIAPIQAAIERAEPRLHHTPRRTGPRGVRDRHGPEAALGVMATNNSSSDNRDDFGITSGA